VPAEVKEQIRLEVAHVLFIDIVGYSKLSINEQRAVEARGGRRINGHRVVPKPTRGFDLIRVVEENLPRCSGA
jgi:hypothetical protein